jgi:hypothetical protein
VAAHSRTGAGSERRARDGTVPVGDALID